MSSELPVTLRKDMAKETCLGVRTRPFLQQNRMSWQIDNTFACFESNDIRILVVEPSGNKRRLQIEITIILTVCCPSRGFSASGQFAAAELILNSTTKQLRRRPDRTQLLLLLMTDNIHPNPKPIAKYPCPVCAQYVTRSKE